nr:hypothetical protein [Tanacetum cinerariifolium]
MIVTQGEGLANPTEPHHTPSPQEHHSPQLDSPPLSHQTIIPKPIPHDLQAPTDILTPRRLTKRVIRIAQSKALSPDADEPASLSRDNRQGEAFPTVSSLDAGHDRENIAKTSAMPHESSPRVPSLDVDEGSMQQRLHKLMDLCTSLQRQQSQMADKIKDHHIEISRLKARVKSLEDKERSREEPIQEDDLITGGIIDIGEELGADKSTEKGSNDTKEMVNVLSLMEAANILSSGGVAASVSPADVFPTAGVPTPMRIPIISAKDKGKKKVTETKVPKKKKLQEQIDAQVAREMEEEFARENQRSNEVIAKHLSEYEQDEVDLSIGENIELISELVKYQDHRAKILKYQAQQSKPLSKKEQREFYMSEDFVPMSSKEESERVKRPGKELKGMMQLVPLEEVYIEALQQFDREDLHHFWILVKETFSIKQSTSDKEKELWVELKRLFEPDFKDQLWTYHQAFMHDPLDWKLYDTCGVHHVSTKNQEIFMLVEKDYPLRKGLATVMIVQDEELFEASSPVEHLIQET